MITALEVIVQAVLNARPRKIEKFVNPVLVLHPIPDTILEAAEEELKRYREHEENKHE